MTSKTRGSFPVEQSKKSISLKGNGILEQRYLHRLKTPKKRAKTMTDLVKELTGKSDAAPR